MTTSYRVLHFPIERLTYRMAKCTQSMALGSGRWRAGGGRSGGLAAGGPGGRAGGRLPFGRESLCSDSTKVMQFTGQICTA